MYPYIEKKNIMEISQIIDSIQEVGVLEIIMQLPEEIVNNLDDLQLCTNLCRNYCEDIEREILKYKKIYFKLLKRKEKRKQTKILIKSKRKFVRFINFYEILEIVEGEVIQKRIYTEGDKNNVIFRIKFKEEKEGIQFISIFLLTYPECILKE